MLTEPYDTPITGNEPWETRLTLVDQWLLQQPLLEAARRRGRCALPKAAGPMGHLRKRARREHCGALSVCGALERLRRVARGTVPGTVRAQTPYSATRSRPACRRPSLPISVVSESGAFAISLRTSPSPIRLNEPFELTVVARASHRTDAGLFP